jgi:phenylalanyl-tRNA synthetase alpha chain
MALGDFVAELQSLARDAQTAFAEASDSAALEAVRVEFLGAKAGRLKNVQKGLGTIAGPDKPAAGKQLNDTKAAIDAAFTAAFERLAGATTTAAREAFDITLPGSRVRVGRLHPITQTIVRM